jgi:hypothetical protein
VLPRPAPKCEMRPPSGMRRMAYASRLLTRVRFFNRREERGCVAKMTGLIVP